MNVFATIAKEGSLSKASRKMGLPLPTVSRRLTELEESLGVTLAIRSTRNFELTDAGDEYLELVRDILDQIEEAENKLNGDLKKLKGHIVITAPVCLGKQLLLPHLNKFLKENPSISIQLLLSDNLLDIVDQHVDLAIRLGNLPDSSLMARHLGKVRKCTVASPQYLKINERPNNPSDLISHRCISIDNINSAQSWSFLSRGKKKNISIKTYLSVNNVEAGLESIRNGLGIGQAYSYQIQKDLKKNTLVKVLEEFEHPALPIHLIYHSHQKIPHRLRAFIDYITPRLRKELE